MAFYNQIFIVFTISLFLTTLPSKAYNHINPKSHAPTKPSSSSSEASKAPIDVSKNIPNVPNTGNVYKSSSSSSSSSSEASKAPIDVSKNISNVPNTGNVYKSSSSSSSSEASKAPINVSKNTTDVPNNGDVSVFINSMMEAAISKTEELILKAIEQRLEEPETDIYATDCLETCKSVYQDAVAAMKKAEEDVKARNYYKANVDISAMSTDIDTCNECAIAIYGDDTEFRQFDNWIQGIANECLEKIGALTK